MEKTLEQLERNIKNAKKRLKQSTQKLLDFETTCQDRNSIYYEADHAILKSDITNINAEIILLEDKLRRAQKEQQTQPEA